MVKQKRDKGLQRLPKPGSPHTDRSDDGVGHAGPEVERFVDVVVRVVAQFVHGPVLVIPWRRAEEPFLTALPSRLCVFVMQN